MVIKEIEKLCGDIRAKVASRDLVEAQNLSVELMKKFIMALTKMPSGWPDTHRAKRIIEVIELAGL